MAAKEIRVINRDTEADRLLHKYFVPNFHKGYVEIGEDKHCMPITYTDWAEKLSQFNVRDSDIFVTGFPRSGTTWLSEMIWLIVNNLNFEGAQQQIMARFPILEVCTFFDEQRTSGGNTSQISNNKILNFIDSIEDPRCIKTHLHWSLLPEEIINETKKPKIIYILRNPKDVCISYYNLHRLVFDYKGTFEDFCTLFMAGRLMGTPYWKQVLSFWNMRHRTNILFIKYRDIKEDIEAMITKVSNFLGYKLTLLQVEQLKNHLNIETMRKNPAVNRDDTIEKFAKPNNLMVSDKNTYIGEGKVNAYLTIMSPEMIKKFDDWTSQELTNSDLIADYI